MNRHMPDKSSPTTVGDPIAEARTLPDIFRARVALTPDALAYRQFDADANAWID